MIRVHEDIALAREAVVAANDQAQEAARAGLERHAAELVRHVPHMLAEGGHLFAVHTGKIALPCGTTLECTLSIQVVE